MSRTPLYICAAMLVIALAPLPYGYYQLLRLVAFGVFAYAAVVAGSRGAPVLPWVLGVFALLFNPFLPVHLDRAIWALLDLVGAALLLVTSRRVAGP